MIGLMGAAGAGKDTAARVLCDEFDYGRVAFADKVRELLLVLDPFVVLTDSKNAMVPLSQVIQIYGWEHAKRSSSEVRRLMQVFATEVCQETFGPDCWTKIGMQSANRVIEAGLKPVFTDVRFPAEHQAITVSGGQIWLISRPHEPNHAGNGHVSEQAFLSLPFHVRLVNDSSLASFEELVRFHESTRRVAAEALRAQNQ